MTDIETKNNLNDSDIHIGKKVFGLNTRKSLVNHNAKNRIERKMQNVRQKINSLKRRYRIAPGYKPPRAKKGLKREAKKGHECRRPVINLWAHQLRKAQNQDSQAASSKPLSLAR